MCADQFCVVIVAIYSLLQSGVTVVLGTLGILASECVLTPDPEYDPQNPFGIFVLSFFRQFFYTQVKCNATDFDVFPEYNMSLVADPAQTEGWLIGYLVDNSLFFIGSLCLLGGIIVKKKWMVNVYVSTISSVILYDIVLTVIYGLDISVAIDPANKNSTFFLPKFPPGVPSLPLDNIVDTSTTMLINSILLMVYFSRFVVFLILNIVCYFVARNAARRISKARPKVGPTDHPLDQFQLQHYPHPQSDPYRRPYPQQPYPHPMNIPPRSDLYPQYVPATRSAQPPAYNNYGLYHDDSLLNRSTESDIIPIRSLEREPRNVALEASRNRQESGQNRKDPYHPRLESCPTAPAPDYGPTQPRQVSRSRISTDISDSESMRSQPTSPLRLAAERGDSQETDVSSRQGRLRRTSNSSASSETVAPELKGQLPWSYVRPNQLPLAGSNKLREFYMHRNKGQISSQLSVPQESDEEKSERNSKFSSSRKYRKPYLETSFSHEALPMFRTSEKNLTKNAKLRKQSKYLSSSADQLCTDEFVVLNYTSKPRKRVSEWQETRNARNLVFDPVSRSIQLIFSDEETRAESRACRREGLVIYHTTSCDGLNCFKDTPGETVV